MTRNLAIIPARGGSKRIPRKNIQPFAGKPILLYSIEAAKKSGLFQEIMVSTDDEEIRSLAVEAGASVPFLRSAATANDYAPLVDVLLEVVGKYQESGVSYDNICCILPTAPLIDETDILRAYDVLLQSSFDSVCPVVAFSYPILRSLKLDENGRLSMNWPEYCHARSQDLPAAYHDSGTFYWIRTAALLRDKQIFAPNGTAVVVDERRVQDIDTPEDWCLAELKYKLIHQQHVL